MSDEQAESLPETPFEVSRNEAKRAQLAMNILVVFSAVAGACFFAYVLYSVRPFGDPDIPDVNVPTSSVKARLGMLVGKHEEAGLEVVLRDIDEAPEYRDELNRQMLADLGLGAEGRLYLLFVRNASDTPTEVNGSRFTATASDGGDYKFRWLGEVAKESLATSVGKMRIAQSAHPFRLEPGEERQLYVFVAEATPPSAEEFQSGMLTTTEGVDIKLDHTEVKLAAE